MSVRLVELPKRFSEHFRDDKYDTDKSKFAQHLIDNKQSIGPIEDIMKVLYKTNKGKIMEAVERYYIYKETYINNQINDKNTVNPTSFSKHFFTKTLAERGQESNTHPSTRSISNSSCEYTPARTYIRPSTT